MYSVAPKSSASAGESDAVLCASRAQVALAPSICLRLAMHALFWLAVRALTKLGMAMAANKAMMATTIMISTRVNPEVLTDLTDWIFISISFAHAGVNR